MHICMCMFVCRRVLCVRDRERTRPRNAREPLRNETSWLTFKLYVQQKSALACVCVCVYSDIHTYKIQTHRQRQVNVQKSTAGVACGAILFFAASAASAAKLWKLESQVGECISEYFVVFFERAQSFQKEVFKLTSNHSAGQSWQSTSVFQKKIQLIVAGSLWFDLTYSDETTLERPQCLIVMKTLSRIVNFKFDVSMYLHSCSYISCSATSSVFFGMWHIVYYKSCE